MHGNAKLNPLDFYQDPTSFYQNVRLKGRIEIPEPIGGDETTERTFSKIDREAYRGYLKFTESKRKARSLGKEKPSGGKTAYTAWS